MFYHVKIACYQLCKKKDGPVQSILTPSEKLDAYMNETLNNEGDPVLHCWTRKGNIIYLALAPIVRELLAVCAMTEQIDVVINCTPIRVKNKAKFTNLLKII